MAPQKRKRDLAFFRACFVEDCHDCGKPINPGDVVMTVTVRSPINSRLFGFASKRVRYCEDCGKLYLESQWKSGSTS